MKKYLLKLRAYNYFGGIRLEWTDYFDTLEEANQNAKAAWKYLNEEEKRSTTIQTGWVISDDMSAAARYCNDPKWFESCSRYYTDESCMRLGERLENNKISGTN